MLLGYTVLVCCWDTLYWYVMGYTILICCWDTLYWHVIRIVYWNIIGIYCTGMLLEYAVHVFVGINVIAVIFIMDYADVFCYNEIRCAFYNVSLLIM